MKKKINLLLTAAMVMSLAAGCGSSSGSTSTSASQTTDTVKTESEKTEDTNTLNLSGRHWKIGGQIRQTSLYLYYARDLGLFEEAGLDVEVVSLSNGPALNEAMNAGELDLAANGMAAVYTLPTENFYYIGDASINFGGQVMFARADSEIAQAGKYNNTNYIGSPETVKGATILGLGSGPQQYIAYAYAEAMGLADDEIEFTAMDHAQAYEAFITGNGDLLATTPPYSNTLSADDNYVMVADYSDLAGGPLIDSIVVNKELADAYPDDVVAILNCMYEAMDRLANDDAARAEYAINLYVNEGGTTYSEDDMASELANVTYWTWEKLANPPYEFGNTQKVMAEFLMGLGLVEEGSMPQIEASMNHGFIDRLLEYRAANGL